MASVDDLSPDLKGIAAAGDSAKIGRTLAADAGDAVAAGASAVLERERAALLSLRSRSPNGLWRRQQQNR